MMESNSKWMVLKMNKCSVCLSANAKFKLSLYENECMHGLNYRIFRQINTAYVRTKVGCSLYTGMAHILVLLM